jgi:hypothetical protein
MKKQITQKLSAFISIILISILIFNSGCSKDTKNPDNGNTTTGNSKIIYTDVNPDSVILKSSTDSFRLDMNNDGINDFVLHRSSVGGICGGDDLFGYSYRYHTSLSVAPANGNNEIITDSAYALALDSSSVIAADSLWAADPQTLIAGTIRITGRCENGPSFIGGHWINVSDKYLGLKFTKDNKIYYGWARMSSSYSFSPTPGAYLIPGQLILKDYAYNSIPNQPILAGQTH